MTGNDLTLRDDDGGSAAIVTITSLGNDAIAAEARDILEEHFETGTEGDR